MPPNRKRKASTNVSQPPTKLTKTDAVSRAGRPLKKTSLGSDNSFVDTTLALGDLSSEEEWLNDEDTIAVKPRRRLSNTPEAARKAFQQIAMPEDSDDDLSAASDTDSETISHKHAKAMTSTVMQPLQIVLKVPKGPAREITLHIDANNMISKAAKASQRKTASKTAQPDKPATASRKFSKNVIQNAGLIGTLPAELREKVYLLVLQSRLTINLGCPSAATQRSSALLKTCRLVYEEGRIILYSRNQFTIAHSSRDYGSVWASTWSELNYHPARLFMKSIGPHNIALLRDVKLRIADRSRAGNKDFSYDARMAVNNEILLSILRDLARYSELRSLALEICTQRHLSRNDSRFVDILTRIKTDELVTHDWANQAYYYRNTLYTRPTPHYAKDLLVYLNKKMVRKEKLHPPSTEVWVDGVLPY